MCNVVSKRVDVVEKVVDRMTFIRATEENSRESTLHERLHDEDPTWRVGAPPWEYGRLTGPFGVTVTRRLYWRLMLFGALVSIVVTFVSGQDAWELGSVAVLIGFLSGIASVDGSED
jgi:hypothetical protein